jgi:O-antigen/teichoic acid export membrane protein
MTEEEGAEQSPDANSDKKAFGKDVGKLVSGTVVAQVVGLLIYPILTRIFDPEIYGIASIFLSIVSVIVVISCLRYEVAILLPKDDKDASSLFFASFIILIAICVVCIPIVLILGKPIIDILNAPDLINYLWILPLFVFVDGAYMILRFWNTRRIRFGMQAISQASQSVTGSGLKVGLGLLGNISPAALIYGQLFGNITGIALLLYQLIKKDVSTLYNGLSIKNIRGQISRYKKFPLIDTWANLFNVISWQVPIFMLSAFFSPVVSGLYAMGFAIIQMPMSLIGGSLGQVYYQRGSIAFKNNKLAPLLEDMVQLLLMLSIIPIVLLLILGEGLFGFVFGNQWAEAGVYCQILAVWAFIWFLSSTTGSNTLNIIEKQEYLLKFSIFNLISRVLALSIGGYYQNIYLALWLFTLFGIIAYGYVLYVIFVHTNASYRKILIESKYQIIFAIVVALIFIGLQSFFKVNIIILLILATIVIIGYYLHLYRYNPKIRAYLPF